MADETPADHAVGGGGDPPSNISALGPREIARKLFALSAPLIGLNVLAVLALAIDTAMLGRLPNAERFLTALSFAVQVIFLLMVAMMGLTVGTVALIARAHGAGERDRVNHLLAQSSMLTVLLGVAVGVVGNAVAPAILGVLGAEPEVAAAALDYLRTMLGGAVFYYLVILYGGVMRGVGNTVIPFVVSLVATAINIAANWLLIYGKLGLPALHIRGAAIGTVLSQGVAVVLLVALMRGGAVVGLSLPRVFRRPFAPPRLDGGLARELFRVGAPAALDMVILNAAFMSLIAMLGRIDQLAVAAHGIGLRVQALAFVPGMSVSQATGAMVGQALGAHDAAQARRVARAAVILCTAIMTTLSIIIVIAARPLVGVFDVAPGTALEDYTVTWMRLLGCSMPPVGVYIAFVGVLQGAGATWTSLRINLGVTMTCLIPLAAILGFGFDLGAAGVWLAFPMAFCVHAVASWTAYRRGRWAVIGVRATGGASNRSA